MLPDQLRGILVSLQPDFRQELVERPGRRSITVVVPVFSGPATLTLEQADRLDRLQASPFWLPLIGGRELVEIDEARREPPQLDTERGEHTVRLHLVLRRLPPPLVP